MKELSMTNVSFDSLRESTEFLNLIINNITSCIMLLDKKMELQAFNESFNNVFPAKKGENIQYVKCGEALGCAFHIEEMKECGKTSHCTKCSIRESALMSYYQKEPIYKDKFSREFYTDKGDKVLKHLQFSTRFFEYAHDEYIILIINDVTELVEKQIELNKKNLQIKKLKAQLKST